MSSLSLYFAKRGGFCDVLLLASCTCDNFFGLIASVVCFLIFLDVVLVVKYCGQLCGQHRDRRLVIERDLAQFIRGLMEFVYPAARIPAEYEVTVLLKPFECECADDDINLYRLHFGQFFRFDISSQ